MTAESHHTHNRNVARCFELDGEKLHANTDASVPETVIDYPDSETTGAKVPDTESPRLESRKEFEFPGVLASVPESRERVMEFVAQHSPDEGDQIDILVAVQEALANAALHGCHDDAAKRIHCLVTAGPQDITITVRDPGPGFDLEKADPEKFNESRLRHGRGIALIRSLMTEVWFTSGGAEIVMRKRLTKAW